MALVRTFIAIPLPYELKQELASAVEQGRKAVPIARWVSENNWHITVIPPQQWDEEEIPGIIQGIQENLRIDNFLVRTKNIILGPDEKAPRMIWLSCQASKELDALEEQIVLATNAMGVNIDMGQNKIKEDKIHITLARFNAVFKNRIAWQPKEFSHEIPVHTLEVLQSELKPSGAVYTRLGEIELSE